MDIKEYIKCFFQNEYEGIWFGQEKYFLQYMEINL